MSKFRSPYTAPPERVTLETGPGKVDQSFANEADINTIVARYKRTGYLVDPRVKATRTPFYDDVSNAPEDLMEAQAILKKADTAFQAIPAKLRQMFGDSPLGLLEWLQNPENHAEARKFGLMKEVPPAAAPSPPGSEQTSGG